MARLESLEKRGEEKSLVKRRRSRITECSEAGAYDREYLCIAEAKEEDAHEPESYENSQEHFKFVRVAKKKPQIWNETSDKTIVQFVNSHLV